jgi:ABC-2 type transport system permease protein
MSGRLWALTRQILAEQRRNILIWGVSMGLLGLMYVALYPSFKDTLSQYLKDFPEAYLKVFGITAGISDAAAFLNLEMFNLLAPLALPFFTILMGARAVAGTEERKALDLLLSNPVPRWQLVVSRYMAMAFGLAVVLLMLTLLTWVAAPVMGVELSLWAVAQGAANLWPFCLFFGALALLCSSVLRRGAGATGMAAGVLIAMYVLNAVGSAVDSAKEVRRASLFYYYGAAILDGIDWVRFIAILLLSIGFTALAVVAFNRRDIYT